MKKLALVVGCFLVLTFLAPLALLVAMSSVPGLGGPDIALTPPVAGLPLRQWGPASIPPPMAVLYMRAAASCPGLSWAVLAAIGTVESGNGTSNSPGVHSGANAAGAEGPMQFEPATFTQYARPVPTGGVNPPSPYDPVDAVYAAARDLCANGAPNGNDLPEAVFAYNHDRTYVARVLAYATAYAGQVDAPGWSPFAGP